MFIKKKSIFVTLSKSLFFKGGVSHEPQVSPELLAGEFGFTAAPPLMAGKDHSGEKTVLYHIERKLLTKSQPYCFIQLTEFNSTTIILHRKTQEILLIS